MNARPARRVAVMQPYFLPYAGYYRLMAQADDFVVYDCVQFPRRGRVHRCQLPDTAAGAPDWLTLPLAPAPRETRIDGMRFAPDARVRLDERLATLDPAWWRAGSGQAAQVRGWLEAPLPERLIEWLDDQLRVTARLLSLPARFVRSSSLGIDPAMRGEARIIEIVRRLEGTEYVNLPGGAALYSAGTFAAAGLGLRILPPYEGRFRHLLPALMTTPAAEIAADIRAT